jgi:hypothetical protein
VVNGANVAIARAASRPDDQRAQRPRLAAEQRRAERDDRQAGEHGDVALLADRVVRARDVDEDDEQAQRDRREDAGLDALGRTSCHSSHGAPIIIGR